MMFRLAIPLALLATAGIVVDLAAQAAAERERAVAERAEAVAVAASVRADDVDHGLDELAEGAKTVVATDEAFVNVANTESADSFGDLDAPDAINESSEGADSPDSSDALKGSDGVDGPRGADDITNTEVVAVTSEDSQQADDEFSVDVHVEDVEIQSERFGEAGNGGTIQNWPAKESKIAVFKLKNLQASAAAGLVQRMFPDETLIIEAEERGNKLLIRCSPDTLGRIKDLISELDQGPQQFDVYGFSTTHATTPPAPPAPPVGNLHPPGMPQLDVTVSPGPAQRQTRVLRFEGHRHPEALEVFHGILEANQRDLGTLVDQIRQLRLATEPDEKTLNDLKKKLHKHVAQAFDARQKLHRAELAILKQQIESIDGSIANRDRNKDKMVEERVDDLLEGRAETEIHRIEWSNAPNTWRPGPPPPVAVPHGHTLGPVREVGPNVTIELMNENTETPRDEPKGALERAKQFAKGYLEKTEEEVVKQYQSSHSEAAEALRGAAEQQENAARAMRAEVDAQQRAMKEQLRTMKRQMDQERERRERELIELRKQLEKAQAENDS